MRIHVMARDVGLDPDEPGRRHPRRDSVTPPGGKRHRRNMEIDTYDTMTTSIHTVSPLSL